MAEVNVSTQSAAGAQDGASGESSNGLPELLPNSGRVASDIQRLAEIGGEANNGVTRLPFSPEERQAHQRVAEWMRQAGLDVETDSFGNTIGVRKGRRPGLPALGMGSHIDSVPHGGRFDGTVGVLGALEVIRMLNEAKVQTDHPIWMVVFASEEGARFGEACLGSKAVTGGLEQTDLDRLKDASGTSLTRAMQQLGMDPAALPACRWRRDDVAAFLELHIEQARVLETEHKKIGLVDAVAGNTRVRFSMYGRPDHSGGTPMHYRKDALSAAAEVVLAAEALANEPRRGATVATVGRLDVFPNSITTIPGRVTFYLDVRDTDSDRQRSTAQEIVSVAQQAAMRRGIELEYEVISDTSPAVLPMWLRDLTTRVCRELDLPHKVMSSGAGHDAAIVSRFTPAAMIFVPSHEGASHCPEEWTSIDDIVTGVRVLARSLLVVDRFLADQVAP